MAFGSTLSPPLKQERGKLRKERKRKYERESVGFRFKEDKMLDSGTEGAEKTLHRLQALKMNEEYLG